MAIHRSARAARGATLLTILAIAVSAAIAPASGEEASSRVFFQGGGSFEVTSVVFDAGIASLVFPGGDRLAVPSSRVLRVERIARTPEPQPAPELVLDPQAAPVSEEPAPSAPVSGDDDIEALIRQAAERHGVEADLLAAVIAIESGFNPEAVSPKGAQGLMQLMPATARELGVKEPLDPRENIDAGARYLGRLIADNGDEWWRALAAYNAGMGRVAKYNGVPPYRETISYVSKVLERYRNSKLAAASPTGGGTGE